MFLQTFLSNLEKHYCKQYGPLKLNLVSIVLSSAVVFSIVLISLKFSYFTSMI